MESAKSFGPAGSATTPRSPGFSEQEKEMMRNEFHMMQKHDFTFIKELGATDAEEYILRIAEIRFGQDNG
jgi:hypothetical protein